MRIGVTVMERGYIFNIDKLFSIGDDTKMPKKIANFVLLKELMDRFHN